MKGLAITTMLLCFMLVCGQAVSQDADTTDFGYEPLKSYHIRANDLKTTPVTNILDQTAVETLGGSATGLLSRIAGVTFTGGSLVSFRGLNPRYTNVTLDGLGAPITEQQIKAFALGLLPSTAVQGMDIFKSGSYVNQGEWGGAVVDIITTANVDKKFNKVSFTLGYQHNFTFKDFLKDVDQGSAFADFLGFGIDRQNFQNDIAPREELQAMNRNEAAAEGAKLENRWALETTTAGPSFDLGFSMGRILSQNGESKLSTINSFVFSRQQGGIHWNRARYKGYEFNEAGEAISSEIDNYTTDGIFRIKSDLYINSGWNYIKNKDNSYNLDLSYAHSGNYATMSKYIVSISSAKDLWFARYSMLAKGVFLARLNGKNRFSDKTVIDWSVGYGNSQRDEPDQRNAAAQRNLVDVDEPYLLVIPESSKADTGARFGSDMRDIGYSGRIDMGHNFSDIFKIRAGFLAEFNDREFAARLISNVKDDFTSPDLRFVPGSDLDIAFEPENFNSEGYYINDGTTDFDIYEGDNSLLSGYAGIDNAFADQRLTTSIGIRVENFEQNLVSGVLNIEQAETDLLPYISANYQADPNTAIKFGYSKSVNRPAFRELSPFQFFDFDYRADIQGNPDLQNAQLDNVDLAVLHTFERNQYISLGVFYKHIERPIEMIYVIRSDKPLFTFDNAPEADLAGVEIEFAKLLANDTERILGRTIFTGSFSYTNSVINLGDSTNEVNSERPLQGQIPLIFTGGLTYLSKSQTSQFTISYKYVGKSLFSVGDGQNTFPWYNAPVHLLNASFGYKISERWSMKLVGLNLLNTAQVQIEDTNFNNEINDEVDKQVARGLSYQKYTLGFDFKF